MTDLGRIPGAARQPPLHTVISITPAAEASVRSEEGSEGSTGGGWDGALSNKQHRQHADIECLVASAGLGVWGLPSCSSGGGNGGDIPTMAPLYCSSYRPSLAGFTCESLAADNISGSIAVSWRPSASSAAAGFGATSGTGTAAAGTAGAAAAGAYHSVFQRPLVAVGGGGAGGDPSASPLSDMSGLYQVRVLCNSCLPAPLLSSHTCSLYDNVRLLPKSPLFPSLPGSHTMQSASNAQLPHSLSCRRSAAYRAIHAA